MRLLVLATFVALFPYGAVAQSWCSAANLNQTEATICRDALLGNLDAQMGVVYSRVREKNALIPAAQSAWLSQRNSCGSDMLCIETSYRNRMEHLRQWAGPPPNWCGTAGLTPTEAAICFSAKLSHLDAELSDLFERVGQASRDAQRNWLNGERNTCGTDIFCIEQAYLSRIADLRLLPAR